MPAKGNQGQNRDRPTGTSGRKGGDTNTGTHDNNDARRNDPAGTNRPRVNHDDDDGSLLGNRTTFG